jgi:hypothetical protein
MHSTHSVGQATSGGSENFHRQFDPDDADWYIMQCAFDAGLDPHGTVRAVRAAQAGQGGNTDAVPIAAPAPAQPPAPPFGWPPGVAGRLARCLYFGSYSPVPEVAVTATIGFLAGVCGRAYRTYTDMDLALYIILVAQSGIGKDSIHAGIPTLLRMGEVPQAELFLRATDFVSGEALHKSLLESPGFLNLQGEFGRKLKRMSNATDTPMQQFRTVMTNAYGKSYLEGKTYSKAENSKLGVAWPALSFLGETTPGTFLECLTPDMMEDGFMSRFLVVSYKGPRPEPNEVRVYDLAPEDLAALRGLLFQSVKYQSPINTPPACIVTPTADAYEKLRRFELDCIQSINATDDESERQVWNRAHLKALKIASLLAAADNFAKPTINIGHVAWALNLVRADIDMFQSRQRSGDIGTDDHARFMKMVAILRQYLTTPVPTSYKVPESMRENSIIPHSYIQIRIGKNLACFNTYRQGQKMAIDHTIRSLMDGGYLTEVEKSKVAEAYNYHGRAYRIVRLPG